MSDPTTFSESPDREAVWRELANQLGGTFLQPDPTSAYVVQVEIGDWIVTLDTYLVGYEFPVAHTRVRAPFANPGAIRFTMFRTDFFHELSKVIGVQDIKVGDPVLDREFMVQANSRERVRKLFSNRKLCRLIQKQSRAPSGGQMRLSVHGDGRTFDLRHPDYPDGVDQLLFEVPGLITDIGELTALFDLFAEALRQLTYGGSASTDDVRLHVRRLRGPGGVVRDLELILWDGDEARRDAARKLGELKDPRAIPALLEAVQSEDAALCSLAMAAIGDIGDPRAANGLLLSMASTRSLYGRHMGDWALDALRRVGRGDLGEAMAAAFEGDPSGLPTTMGDHRPAVIQALVSALDGPQYRDVMRALAEIDAVEALGDLRGLLRVMDRGIPRARAMSRLIDDLEAGASLPRPAQAPRASVRTLPRSAGGPAPDTDALPRSTGERRDEG